VGKTTLLSSILKILMALCRRRHKAIYADLRIMPTTVCEVAPAAAIAAARSA
jgi:hypothetical protein